MNELKALNRTINSLVAKAKREVSKSDFKAAYRAATETPDPSCRTKYLIMAGATLPTLGKLAEATGILPEGRTFDAVTKAVGLVSVVLNAATNVVTEDTTAAEVAQLCTVDL